MLIVDLRDVTAARIAEALVQNPQITRALSLAQKYCRAVACAPGKR